MAWLLAHAEQNPAARFSTVYLTDHLDDGFQSARASQFLRFCEIDTVGPVFDHRRGRTFGLSVGNGTVLGIDEDDPSYPPVPVSEDYRTTWEIDLLAVSEHIRSALGLTGQSARIVDRIYLVGTWGVPSSPNVAVVLALFPSTATAVPYLRTLRATLPGSCDRIAVLLPTLRLSGEERTLLRALRVLPIELAGADPGGLALEAVLHGDGQGLGDAEGTSHAGRVLAGLSLAQLRERYAKVPPRGRRVTEAELAADLHVTAKTLRRHLRRLDARWADVISNR